MKSMWWTCTAEVACAHWSYHLRHQGISVDWSAFHIFLSGRRQRDLGYLGGRSPRKTDGAVGSIIRAKCHDNNNFVVKLWSQQSQAWENTALSASDVDALPPATTDQMLTKTGTPGLKLPSVCMLKNSIIGWSRVIKGLGKNWKKTADNCATTKGMGINNLFLPINFNSLFKIFFRFTHSVSVKALFPFSFFGYFLCEIIWGIGIPFWDS